MADANSKRMLHGISAYFNNNGKPPTDEELTARGLPDNTGYMSGAPRATMPPVQDVPAWAMHDVSAPEDSAIGGVGTLDQLAADRMRMLQQNNIRSQPQSPEPDLSGYRDFKQLRQALAPKMAPTAPQQPAMQGAIPMSDDPEEMQRQIAAAHMRQGR